MKMYRGQEIKDPETKLSSMSPKDRLFPVKAMAQTENSGETTDIDELGVEATTTSPVGRNVIAAPSAVTPPLVWVIDGMSWHHAHLLNLENDACLVCWLSTNHTSEFNEKMSLMSQLDILSRYLALCPIGRGFIAKEIYELITTADIKGHHTALLKDFVAALQKWNRIFGQGLRNEMQRLEWRCIPLELFHCMSRISDWHGYEKVLLQMMPTNEVLK